MSILPQLRHWWSNRLYLHALRRIVKLRHKGRYREAKALGIDILKTHADESALWHALGQISTELGDFHSAVLCHQSSIQIMQEHMKGPDRRFQPAALGLAIALMRYGRFEEAWPLWEAGRAEVSWGIWPGSDYWDGRPGIESLLIQSEGGYGDTFMMMRWLPLLTSEKAVKRIGFAVWKPLVNFCNWSRYGVDEVYEIGKDHIPFGRWKYAISIMSLPAAFRMESYKDIPEAHLDWCCWRGPRGDGRLRIGFCHRAEENSSPVRTKSLPIDTADEISRRLYTKTGCFALSLSPPKKDLYNTKKFPQPVFAWCEEDRMRDWRATAEYLCSMDFVLTVDTAVAHLAGLVGVPTLVLLPKSSCWRWGLPDRATGPWYGSQLTYYRQKEPLVWNVEEIMHAAASAIQAAQVKKGKAKRNEP